MTSREPRPPTAGQRRVVEYWRLVELFSPQQVEKPTTRDPERRVVDAEAGGRRPLPWDVLPEPRARGRRARVWQHTVYVGLYDIEAVYDHLHRVFPQDDDAYDERPPGQSACAAFMVDGGGRMVPGTAVLSSAAWGVGRTVHPGVRATGWDQGFEVAQDRLGVELEAAIASPKGPDVVQSSGVGAHDAEDADAAAPPRAPRITPELLVSALDVVHAVAGVTGLAGIATTQLRIASRVVVQHPSHESPDQPDFLNSFLLDDLLTVSRAPWGPALRQYLTARDDVDVAARIDVTHAVEPLLGATRIERLPTGRWPSDPSHHLATSQQFAVNALAASTGDDPVQGVNGPPGTGKTTLLRDAVAAMVVRRAEALAALPSPQRAFTSAVHTWKAGDYTRRVPGLVPEVTGFEMVLASSNNGAVQNVSDELPRRDAIHEDYGSADYFADLASEVARRQGGAKTAEAAGPVDDVRDCWGLVAARLGNSANRTSFSSAFWFGRNAASQSSSSKGSAPADAEEPVVLGFQQLLKDWESGATPRPSWADAQRGLHDARRLVDELVAERMHAQHRCDVHRETVARLRTHDERADLLVHQHDDATARLAGASAAHRDAASDAAAATASFERHRSAEPGVLEKLLHPRQTAQWRQRLHDLDLELDLLQRTLADAQRTVDAVEAEVGAARAARSALDRARAADDARLARLEHELHDDAARWGAAHPSGTWLADEERRQLHAPWLDRELDDSRSALFLRALDVHRAFWAGAPGARAGLQASIDVVSGAAPRDLASPARRAAWQLFFLAVPLVSTTFASVGRMLRGLEADALGWLFVDEAGQATPQAAVGALWRAQHLLAVGDPMQLTPVVSVPRRMQHDLARARDVADEWVPSAGSVQHLADRVGRYGTHLGYRDEPLWVSAPLRVHRRCASPMFGICNEIAYRGLMIDGISTRKDPRPRLYRSSWFDVPAQTPGSHVQPHELARLRAALAYLRDQEVPMEDVIAVSPFRDVAAELARLTQEHPGLVAGTVHTAQGKEADVVLLVLGGDPSKPGAKRWASATPNLVNVAVSRAKHRLYVIGDLHAWERYPSFDVLAQRLPRSAAADG